MEMSDLENHVLLKEFGEHFGNYAYALSDGAMMRRLTPLLYTISLLK